MAVNLCDLKKRFALDETEISNYYIVKLQNCFWSTKNTCPHLVCRKHLICRRASGELNLSVIELEKLRSSEEGGVCVSAKDTRSVCDDASIGSKLFEERPQKLQEKSSPSICMNRVIEFDESDESTVAASILDQSTTTVSDLICKCKLPSTSSSLSERRSELLIDELLNQLPKTRATDESRKYWEMMLHCERAAFQTATTNLPLPSREARFYWHLYSAAAKHTPLYQKEVNRALSRTIAKLMHSKKHKKGISIWEQLIRLKTFDPIARKYLINNITKFLCVQSNLESICLEGLSLTPEEGVQLLLALYNTRKTMKYVYCWRAFEKMVSISDDTDHRVESGSYTDKKIKKYDWFRAIGSLKFLTTLSVNYAYIATPTGDLLILLAKKLGPTWQWLQLLCMEEEMVYKCNGGTEFINDAIPDIAWKKAHFCAPALKVQYAIIGIPKYDIHKRFFTKSTQIHTFALSTSVDLRFRQPWYLNCTLKTLYSWHSNTLVYLCLQLWHNRENLDNQLKRLFINLPSLQIFEFIGEIRKLKTLCIMCLQIRSCSCNVNCVNMQLQEIVHEDVDKEEWVKSIRCLMLCFERDFEKMGIKFNIDFYCW